jgi:hypothetical protein
VTDEQFWDSVDASGDCWVWTRSDNGHGYGVMESKDGDRMAHRMSWEILVGPIPEGLTLDHLCRNRRCVNPDHLEPVTRGENVLRGVGPAAMHARQTQCVNGHAFTEDNIYHWRGARYCRACRRQMDRDRWPARSKVRSEKNRDARELGT